MRIFRNTCLTPFAHSAFLVLFVMILPSTTGCQEEEPLRVKPMNVSGAFYPAEAEKLKSAVEKHINEAKLPKLEKVRAIIAPHAGYVYSGPTAGYSYAAIKGRDFKTVFVLGPSHHTMFKGISIPDYDAVKSPLGKIPLSSVAKELKKSDLFITNTTAHKKEHSVEVQYPFLQVALKDFTVVPMVSGQVDVEKAAAEILKHLDDETLVVASTDFSHHFDYDTANRLDKATVKMVLSMKTELLELPNYRACGKTPVMVLLHIAKVKGWKPVLLDLRNSGDTAGDKSRVVGYAAIVFVESDETDTQNTAEKMLKLSDKDGQYLVGLARRSLDHYVKTGKQLEVKEKEVPESCREMNGCFVTLTMDGKLRGCIGTIIPDKKLYEGIIENAISAASKDHRFRPVRKDELKNIHVEVSVLTIPKRLRYSDAGELLKQLKPNVDGVILTFMDQFQSTYLPQVWEQIPDKKTFLNMLTKKANPRLSSDAWKSDYAKVFVYQAQVFEEESKGEIENAPINGK